jgi:two-component system, LuxR family, sensor kinase FixL
LRPERGFLYETRMRTIDGQSVQQALANSRSADGPRTASERRSGAVLLVHSLSRRYLFVLLAVALLVMVDQAIIQPQLVRLNFYAPAINVAGRQRMLSQNITKHALALATRPGGDEASVRREQLLIAIDEWTAAHQGLLDGSRSLGLEPIADAHIAAALQALEPKLDAIRSAANQIATARAASEISPPTTSAALETVLSEEPRYLEGMERVVGMLEASAGRQVDFLRWCGVAAMLAIFGLLVGMYFVVLRPALNLIRAQIGSLADSESQHRVMAELLAEARDDLEARVEVRTRELVATNRALQHEIAEREAAEKRMRELSVELAHASRVTALGQFATGLAHEINQPLASIANYADMLEVSADNGTLDAGQTRSTVAQLKQAALRAGRIVRRMRNFVRPTSGKGIVLELNELVREVCDLCRPQLEQADVRLSTDLAAGATFVTAEALEIQQVLVNLVQNAVQALAESPRAQREIKIRTCVASASAFVEVTDTGPGFPPGAAEDAFAPFFTSKPEGLGMGLAISRTILDRYQGRLWGHNRDTGGATVAFCLPLVATNESQAGSSPDCICR